MKAFLAAGLLLLGCVSVAGQSTNAPIDFNQARQLLQRQRSGLALSNEERAYLERAIAQRNTQRTAGPRVRNQRSAPERLIPLTDLTGGDRYEGEDGGLYGGGRNTPPGGHRQVAESELGRIRPLDPAGSPAEDGVIGFISISMSNATQEFSRFKEIADASPSKSPRVVIVDCAQGGQAMAEWAPPEARPWAEALRRLERAGVSPQQVQVAWIKLANKGPTGSLEDHGRKLEDGTLAVLHNAKERFPNLRIVYLGSRIWAGNATSGLNPEPYAYESAFVVRWLIQRQIKGDPELALARVPLLLWGPYLWAEGTNGRKTDPLVWERDDFGPDGVHPSPSGRQKVAGLLLDFFTTDSLAKPWFVKQPAAKASANSGTIPLRDVFELTLQHDGFTGNPFFDVNLDVTFTAPGGKEHRVGGFHYGSSSGPEILVKEPGEGSERKQVDYHFARQNLWKARFAPAETGRWSYAWVFTVRDGVTARGSGSFDCVPGRAVQHGFLRPAASNQFRWAFDDGTPFWPIGLQECIGDSAGVGSVLAAQSLEGPFRLDRRGRLEPPPGALFKPGPSGNPVNGDVYFRQYARAGFNLFRFSQQNCSLPLYDDLDHWLVQPGVMVDELLQHARKYGFRTVYGLFGYQPVFNDHPEDAEGMAKLKRFVEYSVDRWGAYVDIWEFLNEQKADTRWYEIMIPYLRSLDPYAHPVTTSWERPELDGIEVNAPHWYAGIQTDLACDRETADKARAWKRFGKPVILGEQGNWASKEELQTPGIGGVWDVGSSTRMRIRNWVALFNEISFIFWNTSYARDGHNMNIWLGPQERQFVHAMQDFAGRLDNEVRMTEVTVSKPDQVRAWSLLSGRHAAVYLHHFTDHTSGVSDLTVTLQSPRAATAYWYDPQTAAILGRIDTGAGEQTLSAPPFSIDLALLITPDGAPDIDHDSTPNDLDPDDDNDGVADVDDAFPLDPEEWADQDGDLIGDNFDADVDADGRGDDRNENGIPDHDEMDFDADGVARANTVPWDAFPLDPKEWRDSDGDGVGDNADTDRDGDGWPNAEEERAGTDLLDRLSFPSGR